jgi:hypothetical protein
VKMHHSLTPCLLHGLIYRCCLRRPCFIHKNMLFFQVASYNFILPVTINDTLAPNPAPSSIPSSPAPSNANWTIPELDTPPPTLPSIATPCRRVLATALRPPLQLSHSHLKYSLPAGYFDLGIQSDAGRIQVSREFRGVGPFPSRVWASPNN